MRLRSLLSGLPRLHLSISMRLALWYGLSILILLTLFVAYLYTSFHIGLHRDVEQQLRAEADAIEERTALARMTHTAPESSMPPLQASYDTFVRVLSADGSVLRTSSRFDQQPHFSPRIPDRTQSTLHGHTWNGTAARSLYRPIRVEASASAASDLMWLEVTRFESSIHREMHRLRGLLILGIAVSLVLAIGAGYGLARRALRPVAALTAAARSIQEEPTGTLPTDFGVRDELTDLAETFNAMLGRIRAAFARERAFRADAAHKMFTPLTAIQSELDVTLRASRSEDAYRATLKTIRTHTAVLSDMLDELMTLSEIESMSSHADAPPLDLADRVQTRVHDVRDQARAQGIGLQVERLDEGAVAIPGPSVDLLANHLIDNALKYTQSDGCIQVAVTRHNDEIVLRVTDDGMGFAPSKAQRLFDRFYRSADAEAEASGSGLGLSIVQAVARAHHGTVKAESHGIGQGSTFTVRLPRAKRQ